MNASSLTSAYTAQTQVLRGVKVKLFKDKPDIVLWSTLQVCFVIFSLHALLNLFDLN